MASVRTWVGLGGLGLGLCLACNRPTEKPAPTGDVVAVIEGDPITREDLDQALEAQSAFVKARYTSPERRKELLLGLVQFEVLAREAEKRGYARDPDVLRFVKQRSIEKMFEKELDPQIDLEDLGEAEMTAYYQAHPESFTQDEAVRLSQIVLGDEALATEIAAQARALDRRDEAGFRRLVERHSVDDSSKARGGDTTFLVRNEPGQDPGLLAAGFALAEVGEVAGPIRLAAGDANDPRYAVIRLTQRRAKFLRPFEEVKPQVRNHLYREKRAQKVEEWVKELRGRMKVEVFADKLQGVSPNMATKTQPPTQPRDPSSSPEAQP